MITSKVIITKSAEKQATRAPQYIRDNLLYWKKEVELFGIQAIRQHKGYHDEPLKGKRLGERSIRLSRQWRAFYLEKKNGIIEIYVLEVTPHEYKK